MYTIPPVPPCPGPALGESKQNFKFFFNYLTPEMFYVQLKSFDLIKVRNNDVIIIEKSCFGEL